MEDAPPGHQVRVVRDSAGRPIDGADTAHGDVHGAAAGLAASDHGSHQRAEADVHRPRIRAVVVGRQHFQHGRDMVAWTARVLDLPRDGDSSAVSRHHVVRHTLRPCCGDVEEDAAAQWGKPGNGETGCAAECGGRTGGTSWRGVEGHGSWAIKWGMGYANHHTNLCESDEERRSEPSF